MIYSIVVSTAINEKDGNVTVTTKTEKADGTTEEAAIAISVPDGSGNQKITVNPDGSVDIPKGGVVENDTTERIYPDGGKINFDGSVEVNGTVIEKDKESGSVVIIIGEEIQIKIEVAADKKDEVEVDSEGNVTVPAGSKIGGEELPFGGKVNKKGEIIERNPDPNPNPNPGFNPTPDEGNGIGSVVTEDEQAPLAGIVAIKNVLSELYKHEGIPNGEDSEGEYANAIGWAISNDIISDESVT